MNIWLSSGQPDLREELKDRLLLKKTWMLSAVQHLHGALLIRVGEKVPDQQLLCRGMLPMFIASGYRKLQVKSTDCLLKLNGNMPAGQQLKPLIILLEIRKISPLQAC